MITRSPFLILFRLSTLAKLGAGTQRAYAWVRGLSKFMDEDRSLGGEVETVGAAVLSGELSAVLH